jgi:hypothetical protein
MLKSTGLTEEKLLEATAVEAVASGTLRRKS